MRTLGGAVAIASLLMVGCAVQQRAQLATDAKTKLVGLPKEQVLACMGPPARRHAEGITEVWSYNSGDGHTSISSSSTELITGAIDHDVTATRRFCVVDVVMTEGKVSRLNYSGPTGGILSQGEQCGFAVKNCVH